LVEEEVAKEDIVVVAGGVCSIYLSIFLNQFYENIKKKNMGMKFGEQICSPKEKI
jgi:hypothetical protein